MEQYILVFRKAERMLCSEACEQANAKVASYDDLNFLARNYSQFLAEECETQQHAAWLRKEKNFEDFDDCVIEISNNYSYTHKVWLDRQNRPITGIHWDVGYPRVLDSLFIILDQSFQMRSKRNIYYGVYDSNTEQMADKIMKDDPFFGEEAISKTLGILKANYWCANDTISSESLRNKASFTDAIKDCAEHGINPIRIDDDHTGSILNEIIEKTPNYLNYIGGAAADYGHLQTRIWTKAHRLNLTHYKGSFATSD